MPTTEELIARLGAVLDHGPVSGSSLQYALDTLATLAQRTRDLAGERDRLRDLVQFGYDVLDNEIVIGGMMSEMFNRFQAALAPAEAGTPEPDERIPCRECPRWHHDAADWGTAGVCMARLRKLGPPGGEDEYEERDADDGCSDRSERKPVTEEEGT